MRIEKICNEENPYTPERDKCGEKDYVRWVHPKAKEEGEQEDGWPGGDIVRMRCPVCGISWKSELPQ